MTDPSFDPGYTGEIASCIRGAFAESTGFEVVADATLTDRAVEISSREHLVKVRPGQPLRRFHLWMGRAWLYTLGGVEWAPEFRVRPRLRLVEAVDRGASPPLDRVGRHPERRAPSGRHLCDSCRRALREG